jgi:F-type H+-transporting ATPase subunit delta
MAENVTLARPYAEAAFRIARDAGQLDAWLAMLTRIAAIADAAEVRAVIDNPKVETAAVVKLLIDVVASGNTNVSTEQKNFVSVLAESDRLTVLGEIRDLYVELKNGVEGVKEARIESAFPLDGAPLANLVADLERRFQCRINAAVEIDPELIGGVRIAVGDEVIDASVRGKLAAMASALKH